MAGSARRRRDGRSTALVAARHLRRGVPELFLDVALVDLGRAGQAGAQGVTREEGEAVFCGNLSADSAFQHGGPDQPRDVFVRETAVEGALAVPRNPHEDGAEVDPSEVQPLFQRVDGAAPVRRPAGDLDLAPAGLGVEREDDSALEDLDPAPVVGRAILVGVEADNFRAPEPAGIADQQDRPIPDPAQIVGQGRDHCENVFGQDRLFLDGRTGMLAPDSGQPVAM